MNNAPDATPVYECRSCGSKGLSPILDLGSLYVTNFLNAGENPGPKIPLELVLCDPQKGGCGLGQTRHNTNPALMWNDQYWYKSGINAMIREDLRDIVTNAKRIMQVKAGDLVVDIGANDGTLLSSYQMPGLNMVGFEPSKNVAREAASKGIPIINDFFNARAYGEKLGDKKAKIISAISMFYDLDKPNDFVGDITKCLDKNGLFIIQQNYLATMLSNNAVDNICHEHLEYYSLGALEKLLNRHGLETFDVAQNGINGGSIRTYIRFKDSAVVQTEEAKKRVEGIYRAEAEAGLDRIETYQAFANRVNSAKNKLTDFLVGEKAKGKRICGCGASTRGNTTLQYFGLTPDLMECIADRNPDKWGKVTVGTNIPIVSPEEMAKLNPDYQTVLIWHIFKGLGKDELAFVDNGGKFILPLPEPMIVDKYGAHII